MLAAARCSWRDDTSWQHKASAKSNTQHRLSDRIPFACNAPTCGAARQADRLLWHVLPGNKSRTVLTLSVCWHVILPPVAIGSLHKDPVKLRDACSKSACRPVAPGAAGMGIGQTS